MASKIPKLELTRLNIRGIDLIVYAASWRTTQMVIKAEKTDDKDQMVGALLNVISNCVTTIDGDTIDTEDMSIVDISQLAQIAISGKVEPDKADTPENFTNETPVAADGNVSE